MDENQPIAPPTDPVPLGHIQLAPVWPTLLGIASMVLGILGILGAIMAIGSVFTMSLLENVGGQNETIVVMRRWNAWIVGSGIVNGVLAALLAVAGFGLAQRRAWGVSLQKKWAIAKLLWVPVLCGVNFVMQLQQSHATNVQMSRQATPMPVPLSAAMESLTIVGAGVMFLWMIALPVFCLVWFRVKHVREEISTWAPRRPATPPLAP